MLIKSAFTGGAYKFNVFANIKYNSTAAGIANSK
jgi:hypothetical protein